jgi:CRP-like cAMP-binding protein
MGVSMLNKISLFSQMDEKSLNALEQALVRRSLPAGEVLFHEGDAGEELILVEQGSVAIFSPLEPKSAVGQALRIFKAGEVLGEMALIDLKPRSASARAEEESVILALSRTDFEHLVLENTQSARSVMGALSEKIRYTTEFLNQVRGWVGKIAEGDYNAIQQAQAGAGVKDTSLAALAAEFTRMAANVQQREEKLREEVSMLRIEIDEVRRKQEVEKIISSDYYQNLKEKIRRMREEDDE